MTAPVLIIGIGNPSRGDDALGPLLIEHLETLDLPGVELLTDFQLQVEYALDLQGRTAVIFVDAAVAGPEPFSFETARPAQDTSYSSHELSPAAVLHTCEQLYGTSPEARILAIRGYQFDLGAPPSPAALANLDAASRRLLAEIA
ncbi:MAG: hydrogenase maturation protease [Gallionellaceae bacterium]|nr:hydrogenase maturation protease [Gallionellaceae bacterium]